MLHLPLEDERARGFALAHGILPLLIHAVEQVFELVELLAPESSVDAEPVHDRPQGFRMGAVARFPADASIAYEASLLQHVQMLRNSRLRNGGAGSKSTDGSLALAAQPFE